MSHVQSQGSRAILLREWKPVEEPCSHCIKVIVIKHVRIFCKCTP